jgi:hypothetical protein
VELKRLEARETSEFHSLTKEHQSQTVSRVSTGLTGRACWSCCSCCDRGPSLSSASIATR